MISVPAKNFDTANIPLPDPVHYRGAGGFTLPTKEEYLSYNLLGTEFTQNALYNIVYRLTVEVQAVEWSGLRRYKGGTNQE